MPWVTVLGPDVAQVDYRLRESAGCGEGVEIDPQLDYRMDDTDSPLTWVGSGLAEFGLPRGEAFGVGDADAARLIMDGRNPLNKDRLVAPKEAVHPAAKLPAADLVDAVRAAADRRGQTPAELFASRPLIAERFAQLERGLERERGHHTAPIRDLERVARAAKIVLADVYGADTVATARERADEKVRVGNRGYDLTLDVPKSYSVLQALAPPELAQQLQDTYAEAVADAVEAMEAWAGYATRGHNGNGQRAKRIEGTGLLGWSMTHHTARPVDDHAPDPHLHAHVSIANMVKGVDGKWSTVGAGGRDIMRHGRPAGALMHARLRQLSQERFGTVWEQNPATGAWEVAGIDARLRDVFSKRGGQVAAAIDAANLDPAQVTSKQRKLLGRQTAKGKGDYGSVAELRAEWRRQAAAAGYDVDQLVATAAPGPTATRASVGLRPDAADVAAIVFDPATGLTANRKSFSRADLLAVVADASGEGLADRDQLETLTDDVLALEGWTERLGRDVGGPHLSNADRYTTSDIVDAEVTVLEAADDRLDAGYAAVDAATAAAAISGFEDRAGFLLSDEQRAVVTRLTTQPHGIDAVIGVAGSGKTTVMQAVRMALESGGHRVAGASTAAVAAHHLQAETGIASTTVATWVWRIDNGRGLAGVDALVVDEAGMVDDRDAARLAEAAAETGTKIINIGDPLQLRSPGVGSTFGDVHGIVDGLSLTENRRQRDETHRAALRSWRDGGRRAALDQLADAGCIHAEDSIEDTHAAMIGDWDSRRHQWPDPHDAIAQHLMLAATNDDVHALNDACQAIRLDSGDLVAEAGYEYRAPDGRPMTLHPHDIVMTRINDRDQKSGPSVLNGYRGVVLDVDADTGAATIQWRDKTPHGTRLREQTLTRDYIERGGAQLGYALTVHKAQGQTAESVTGNLTGLEPTAAYPLLTRHKGDLNVWLTRDPLEDDATRAELGEPGSDAEKLRRAIDAYARQLERPDTEELAIAELGEYDDLLLHRDASNSASRNAGRNAGDEIDLADDESTESPAPQRMPEWWQRHHGGLTPGELERQLADARRDAVAAERDVAAWTARNNRRVEARQARVDAATAGHGQRAQDLTRRRDRLTEAIRQADAAATERAAAAGAQDRINTLAAQQRELRDRAARNPLGLRLAGTTRAQLQAEAADLGVRLNDLVDERDRHAQAARDHTAAADAAARGTGLPDHTTAPQSLAEVDNGWDDRYAAAIAADRDQAAWTPPMEAAFPDPAPDADAAEHRRREAEALGAEADLRADRPAAMAEWEDRDRAAARAQAAEELQRDTADDPDPADDRRAAALDAEREAAAAEAAHQAALERAVAKATGPRRPAPRRDRGPERDDPGIER